MREGGMMGEFEIYSNTDKISEADIIQLFNQVNLHNYPIKKLCLIIHPSKEQDLLDILQPYSLKEKTEKVSYHIKEIFGMTVYKDEKCPPNKIHILPEPEYRNMKKTLLWI